MKHPYNRFLPSFVILFFTIAVYAQSDIYESYAILSINGNSNSYYDLYAVTGNPDFDGNNLGTFNPGNSLILNGAQNKTYKCGTHNIMNSYIDYRIYEASAAPGPFIPHQILFNQDDLTSNYCTGSSTDQTWESTGANINVLNGLTSGDYILEVYVRADVDDNNDNISDFTLFNSNSGANFSANFRVDNPPTALCQDITVQLDASGNASITASNIDNGSTDDFDTPTLSIDRSTFDCSDIGTPVIVTLTVEDALGQIDTCTAQVTVEDNINPSAICQNITIQLDASGNASITTADIDNGSNDNCGSVTLSASQTSFTCADIGTNNVTLTVDDGNGQTDTCVAVVTVEDNINPTAVCQNITVQLDSSGNATILPADIDGGSSDNCGSITLSTSQTAFTCADIGINNVTLTVDDGNGQTDTCVAAVTVEDNIAPNAVCQDITVQLDSSGNATILSTDIDGGSTDNCGSVTLSASQTAFTCANIGTNNVTLTIDDGNGQTDTCTAVVTIEDNVAPNAVCQDITVQLDSSGNATILPADIDGGSSDNCGSITLSASQTAFTCADIGTNNVTLTVNDGNGQTDICTAIVTVEDNVAPNALCQDITIQLDASGNASITTTDIDNGSSDSCGISFLSLSQTFFDCSDIGINTVTLTVRDIYNNESTCTANVTVTDPAENATVSITVDNNPVCDGDTPTFTATPINGGASPVYEWFINGTSVGNNSPIFTPFTALTDGDEVYVRMQSSLSSCIIPKQSNSININVNSLPNVSGPATMCVGSTTALTPAISGWVSNTGLATVDNSGIVTANSSGTATFTFTDGNGCSSDLTITINDLPVVSAPSSICVNETDNLSFSSSGTWVSSNTAIATVTNAGSITGISPGLVNFTFTDGNGCSATTNTIEVFENPTINSVSVSNSIVCAGTSSILTADVQDAGNNDEVIVNYNFNTGSTYNTMDGQEVPGITSSLRYSNIYVNYLGAGTATQSNAYVTENTAGNAIRQLDNDRLNDEGFWTFDMSGSNLNTYQNFSVYFQTKRATAFGEDKYVYVFYRVNGTGGLVFIERILVNNTPAGTQWQEAIITIPTLANNPNQLEIMLGADDGYDGTDNSQNPDILIDNVQVRATSAPDPLLYSWTASTGASGGLPVGADIPSSGNNVITVIPEASTTYTLTVTNGNGCSTTQNAIVNTYASPNITVAADYCPADDPSTPQDESNMVMLVASSSVPITNWTWLTDPTQTGDTIYVDTSGTYQVTGTTADGCAESASFEVAQELVFNGTFSIAPPTTDGDFGTTADDNYNVLGFDYDEDYTSPSVNGYRYFANPVLTNNTMNVTIDSYNLSPSNFRSVLDHTNDLARRFLAVNNGGNSGVAAWRQEIVVEPNTEYYFSAWGIDLSRTNNPWTDPCDLRFRINGVEVGNVLDLVTGDDWKRLYGIWNSGTATTAIVEIISLNPAGNGNNFGIDDISFATLSTFITLTSFIDTTNQVICEGEPIVDITYDIGGGLNPPTITGLPTGLTTTFDGLELVISGTPTQYGVFNYTLTTNSSCDVKTATGQIDVRQAALADITEINAPVCYSDGSIPVSATLSGSAAAGVWSTSGDGTFSGVSSDGSTATYNFGATDSGVITLTFTTTIQANSCDPAVDTETFEIIPYIVADAGLNIDNSASSCSDTTVTLAANDVTGQWTVTSGQATGSYYFSDASTYNSTFTGESGETYTLQWEAINTMPCINTTDTMTVTFANCGNNLDFDGTDDYINFSDNYGLTTTPFSIEAWIKADNLSGIQTILSKRNSSNLNTGYDLSLINNRLAFRWDNQTLFSTQTINTTKWYHVAVTFNGTDTHTLYIDGFVMQTSTGASRPSNNTSRSLVGAMDDVSGNPTNHFDGNIDELRLWNVELTIDQIRDMMNQEIEANGANVRGSVIPLDITGGLLWNDLNGYYQMRVGSQTSILNGNIQDIATSNAVLGKLNKMTTSQVETAPMPYTTQNNGNWDTTTTWTNGATQQLPNSTINSINGLAQTWNIVVTNNNVTTNRPTQVASLDVDSNSLFIGNDESLQVDKYLKIDGTLDLEGQSQLLQPMGSIVDYTGNGKLERDQQGTSNLYNYNYWTSPVSTNGTNFSLSNVLHEGVNPVSWTNAYDANPSTNPITLSRAWLYLYENYPENSIADWRQINESSTIQVGLGFSMKGSGSTGMEQNYTFVGQPNNGTITSPVSGGYQALVGNPYPSAIDANAFINDNIGILEDGSLYFWEHAASNNSHSLNDYEGGYAVRNLMAGLPAVSPPEVSGSGNANKIPGRYVPVAQGFFVTGNATGGNIMFRNSQRVFVKEQGANSIFMRNGNQNATSENTTPEEPTENQLIRLDFIGPENAVRHLVIGFTDNQNATDGIDYGYDAINQDAFPNDMSFDIEGEKFVIQGVNTFDETKAYPLDIDLANGGNIEIALAELENFDEAIDVFIFDALDGSYTRINDINFQDNLDTGHYTNRFYLVFQENTTLSTNEETLDRITISYLQNTNEIYVRLPHSISIEQMRLVNILGQTVTIWNANNLPTTNTFKIPVEKVAEGSYILKVKTNLGMVNKKLIVKY